MFGATNSLSLAASAIWRGRQHQDLDYQMDGSGELGASIAAHHHASEVAVLAEHGFTPESYNAAIRRAIGTESYAAYRWLTDLSVDPDWVDNNTFVCTNGYPGHPEAEYSSVAYLKGA